MIIRYPVDATEFSETNGDCPSRLVESVVVMIVNDIIEVDG